MIPENQRLVRLRDKDDELTCIVCPIGCRLAVDRLETGELRVTGNRCNRGVRYAEAEFSDPRRTVTGTCAVEAVSCHRLPVKSSAPVPIGEIPAFLNAIYEHKLNPPIRCGQVIERDAAGTGIDILATMTVEE